MLSLQRFFGRKNQIFELLQASAEAARDAACAVDQLLRGSARPHSCMATFRTARRREKELAAQLSEALINTFVTPLDREDIQAIGACLYRIPKNVEKFAARHTLVLQRLQGVDFSARSAILLACTDVVVAMVGELQQGLRIEPMRRLQAQLQELEAEGDELLLEPYGELYLHATDPIRVLLAKDLFETLEKAIDACRDVGNVVYSIVLKNS